MTRGAIRTRMNHPAGGTRTLTICSRWVPTGGREPKTMSQTFRSRSRGTDGSPSPRSVGCERQSRVATRFGVGSGHAPNSRQAIPSLRGCGRVRVNQLVGFTLIELILVMALLAIAIGVTFPTLRGFFRGRVLDSEARRLLSLTRYGQSRAVSEGVPMVLWIDARQKTYGLESA